MSIMDPKPLTKAAGDTSYARTGTKGVYLDVTAGPYNAKADGTTDDYNAINNAAAACEAQGGGTVFLPRGTYRISAYLQPRNNVRYQGAGIGKTIIKPYQSAAFTGHGTLAAPIQRPEWVDMTWDGSDIPASNSLKGHFSMYLKDALWLRVECKNFTATGFGSDYLPGGRYIDCVATGNGRGQAIDGPGMSGFGIGTGQYQVEDVLVQGCKATGNTNYGIFVERQPDPGAFNSLGVRIVGNYVDGNGYGIGGCGVDSAVYSDNIVANAVRDGITLHAGSGASPLGMPDKRAIITGNHVYGCGRDGIHIDYEQNSIPANQARHIIEANNVHNNARDGFRLIGAKWASDVVRGIKLALNKFTNNGGYGINVVTATGAEAGATIADLTFTDNDLNGNTLDGLHIAANMLRLVVKGNKGHDDQATKTQSYGISTDAGYTLTDATVRANELIGNKTGPALFNATWVGDCDVRGNKGYIPGWASITVAASPFTYTCGVTPETVYWAGGSTTSVKITPKGSTQATVLLATGSATLPIEPGDVLEFAYSASPTSLKTIRRQ